MKCKHGDTPGVWSFRVIYGITDASAVTSARLRMRRKVWLDPVFPTGAVIPIVEGEDHLTPDARCRKFPRHEHAHLILVLGATERETPGE
jgi:hypothetical protein